MIFCSDLLFLHVPRTAGMSMTRCLVEVLPRPTWYVRPPRRRPRPHAPDGVVEVDGPRHATLVEAPAILQEHGYRLSDFPVLLVAIRNPYDLEVSRYAHLQKGLPHQRSRDRQLAMTVDFETFARESKPHANRPLEDYFVLDGAMPDNLNIVRFEDLTSHLTEVLSRIGIGTASLPDAINASSHDHFSSYYTPSAEEAVYHKYRWAFDSGFYERRDFSR